MHVEGTPNVKDLEFKNFEVWMPTPADLSVSRKAERIPFKEMVAPLLEDAQFSQLLWSVFLDASVPAGRLVAGSRVASHPPYGHDRG